MSEFAYVVGDVEIGAGSSVWPGAVVRADSGKISIGQQTCIQDNSVVHGDSDVVIGDRVVIGHRVLCHAREVGDGVFLDSGATVNDGVVIGGGSVVASGAVLIENMEITSDSLVEGIPGRVRGEVEEVHREIARSTVDDYSERAQQYRREGGLESGAVP